MRSESRGLESESPLEIEVKLSWDTEWIFFEIQSGIWSNSIAGFGMKPYRDSFVIIFRNLEWISLVIRKASMGFRMNPFRDSEWISFGIQSKPLLVLQVNLSRDSEWICFRIRSKSLSGFLVNPYWELEWSSLEIWSAFQQRFRAYPLLDFWYETFSSVKKCYK